MTALDLETGATISEDSCTSTPSWLTTASSSSATASPSPIICRYFTFVLYGMVAGTVCVFGLIGNLISVAVLSQDSKTPVASVQLMALAVADNLFRHE